MVQYMNTIKQTLQTAPIMWVLLLATITVQLSGIAFIFNTINTYIIFAIWLLTAIFVPAINILYIICGVISYF